MSKSVLNTIGLMSGTSLDGVDLVLVEFSKDNSFKILNCKTIMYNDYWLKSLKNVSKISKESLLLSDIDTDLGKYFSKLIIDFVKECDVDQIDLIASHGHTVHHQPNKGYTLQIGCGEQIRKLTGIKTIYNFRSQDVLLGGQGAPLVPIGDEMLFSEYDYCLNLGGFSNISYNEKGVRRAFDICPVNTVLNFFSQKLGQDYDKNGSLAKSGNVNQNLLAELNAINYYHLPIPKSLGVEFLETYIYPIFFKYELSHKDFLRTFVEHIAHQICKNIRKGTVLVTGGGAFNVFLMERLKRNASQVKFVIPSNKIVEFKEALVFALLGKLRLEGKVNCLSSVTGAIKDHSSGVIID
ncbi:anhydro-N-acetylmuramic acid kinase [Wenyingzhuangia sp. IMCC45533]